MSQYHKYSETLVDKSVEKGKITWDDAELIKKYLMDQNPNGKVSSTQNKIFYNLLVFREFIGEYRKNTFNELFMGVTEFKKSGRKSTTVTHYLAVLRQFYLWLIDSGYSAIPREMVENKIKTKNPENMSVTADSILSKEDVIKLIEACKNNRNRAIIALLYEASLRPKEVCLLTWKQFKFNEHEVILVLKDQTTSKKQIRCLMGRDYILSWRNDYPDEATGDNLVFVTHKGNPFTHQIMLRLIGRIAKDSGIKKVVHPHILRRSKALFRSRSGNKQLIENSDNI